MNIPYLGAELDAAYTKATTQEADVTAVIHQAEQAKARLREVAAGTQSPLAARAVDSYADAVVKLREGAALLADVIQIMIEYARSAAIELPAAGTRRAPINIRNAHSGAYAGQHGQAADAPTGSVTQDTKGA